MEFDRLALSRRHFLCAGAVGAVSAFAQASPVVFRPEDFGARGDGATNDTGAFGRMSKAVNRHGGGTIVLKPGKTYVVGTQSRGSRVWKPDPIIELRNLSAPLLILGNGARLLTQPGLRFGTFDPASGKPTHHPMPNLDPADLLAV